MTGGLNAKPFPDRPEGYRGVLNGNNVFIPELLREAGYATLMTGKWHIGPPGPIARGFDEYYGMLHGFDSFWEPKVYTRLPEDRPQPKYRRGHFYATDALTDYALDFVKGARAQGKPWFLYAAYNAAHFPLHAPKAPIEKYVPVYEEGWDAIRERRFARLRELKLIDPRWEFPPRSIIGPNRVSKAKGTEHDPNPAWNTLDADRRHDLARRMAIFAAMVESMDRNIGRLVDDLSAAGELDNTLILFFSDNGACSEWDPYGFDKVSGPINILHKGRKLKRMGQRGTYHSYGSGWANACATPWRMYKHYAHEGGISTPFIAHWPRGGIRPGVVDHQPAHLIDILPTLTGIGGASYPAERAGKPIPKAEGISLLPALQGRRLARTTPLFFEHEGNRAMRDGKWKLVAMEAGGPWELYDMEADRTEMHNLSARHPERVRDMEKEWDAWARRTKVLPWMWNPKRS